jgi:hypothetical protein
MKKSYQVLILVVLYFIALGFRIYWLSQKDGFHVDEGMTIAISFYNDYIMSRNYDFNREYTGKEIKEKSLINNSGFKETLLDIKRLWKDNRDSPHTNLYYTFLRISLMGLETTDIKPIIFRGGILNLIFFTVSFVFFFLLMRLLFPDSVLPQFTALICAFLSTAALSNTLFLRPYQIQETVFIIFAFLFVKNINIKNFIVHDCKKIIGKVSNLLLLSFITALTFLTGYYAVIFIGLFGLYIVYYNCKNKTFTEIIFYFLVLCFGFLLTLALYQKYMAGFTSYRALETKFTLSANVMGNIKYSIIAGVTLLWKHFFTLPVLIFCAGCVTFLIVCKQKLIVQKQALFIFIVSILYLFLTLIIAPYKILRYSMPVFPFFVILPAMLINSIRMKTRKGSAIAMSVLFLCFIAGAVNQNNIQNIFKNKPDEYVFNKEKDVPVYVIVHRYSAWKYGNLVPYFNDDQKYYFFENYDDIFYRDSSEFFLVIENLPWYPGFDDERFEILKEFPITGGEVETVYNYYNCAKVRIRINECVPSVRHELNG